MLTVFGGCFCDSGQQEGAATFDTAPYCSEGFML